MGGKEEWMGMKEMGGHDRDVWTWKGWLGGESLEGVVNKRGWWEIQ